MLDDPRGESQGFLAEEQPEGVTIPILRIKLNPGISLFNIFTFFYASFANVCALVFLNGSMPYLLTNFLHIPQDEQGTVTGNILVWNEIAVIIFVAFWGIVSDRLGRKVIYCLGFFLMGLSIMLHPAANSYVSLVLIRVIFGVGAAASVSMLTAILSDYPTYEGKGRSAGVVGLCTGCGALLAAFVFLRIPSWARWGLIAAGQTMYWSVGGFFILTAMFLWVGLSDVKNEENKHQNIFVIIKEGFMAGKNPKIALSYLSSFAARGDAIILTTFLALWVNKYELKNGASDEEALALAGTISGIAQTMALVAAPLFGLLSDYFDHVLMQVIAAGLATAGYLWVYFLTDPTSTLLKVAIVFVGAGEIGMIVTSQILVSAESPANVRGSVSGFFGLAGSVSITITTRLGGYLFDNWEQTGPFLLVAVFNGIVLLTACVVFFYTHCRKYMQLRKNNATYVVTE